MSNRGRHKKKKSKYSFSWIHNVLSDDIINRMLNIQEQHSTNHIRNLNVFEKDPYAGKYQQGFNWDETPEGREYWNKIFTKVYEYKKTNL